MTRAVTDVGVEVDVSVRQAEGLPEPSPVRVDTDPADPFRILVLGDFGGRKSSARKPVYVDRHNLHEVLTKLHVELHLRIGNAQTTTLSLVFKSLEDFEPDAIFRGCELFRQLDTHHPKARAASAEQGGGTGVRPETAEAGANAHERIHRMNLLMSAILHDPRFQALEAAWRSLQFLASRLETKESLKLYLLDISKEDLSAELLKADDFRKSAVYHAIVEDTLQVPDAEPWALLVGNYGFDRNDEQDLQLLERMGLLGRAAGAPFLAQCVLSSSGNTRAVRFWKELRRSSYAGYLGLAVPRVLLRLPYGLETRRIDSFAFEEMPAHRHEQYLWGNPAFACASLLAGGFAGNGWKFGEGAMREIHGLPMHVYNAGRGRGIQPCAEMALTEGECDQLLREGFMPLYASRDRDVLKVVSFQSIAEPQAPLSGRWGE